MRIVKSLSGKTILLIFFIFSLSFFAKIQEVVQNEKTCVCAYDGFGYYMYLPHFFEKQSLRFTNEWARNLQNDYCDSTVVYQLVPTKKGGIIDEYQMGMAYILLPSFWIGDLSAKLSGFKQDGFSKPYHIAYLLNALLFIFLGLLYLRKLLLLFFNEKTTTLIIFSLFFASNIYITYTQQYALQHLFLFALNGVFLFHFIRFRQKQLKRDFWISAVILGLTVAIRPTQVLLGIIPLIFLFKDLGKGRRFWSMIIVFPIIGLIWNIPQIIYWWTLGGEPFILNLHDEKIILTDPNLIDFLFSYKKGWLLYSPIFLLLIPGFIALSTKNRPYFMPFLVFSVAYIYVMSAWECWWYASSFGSRVMVDIYPLLAIILGYFILSLLNPWKKLVGSFFISGCIVLTILQSLQFEKGYLHHERMTKQHYWYIFGQTHMPDYSERHLELDRTQLDTNWVKQIRSLPTSQYEVQVRKIFSLEKSLKNEPFNDLTLGRLNLLELIPSDETLFEVKITAKTSDSTKYANLRMENVNRYSCYGWNNFEISFGKSQNKYVTHIFKFNLANIRHNSDQMQMYLDIWENVTVDVKEMNITSYSLIRK